MTSIEFANMYSKMSGYQKDEFLKKIKVLFSEEEYLTTVKFLASFDMMNNPAKYNAMKKAMAEQMYSELKGA